MTEIFQKKIKDNAVGRSTFDYSDVLFQCQNYSPDLYAVKKEYVFTPDDELHCGEPWHDYGNYKNVGITDNNSIYTLWDCETRTVVLYSTETKKFYSSKEQGQWWNHSENNDTPGRRAFDKEIEADEKMTKSVEMFFSAEVEKEIAELWKTFKKEDTLRRSSIAEKRLLEAKVKLEDLKVNHRRAWKQIENAEAEVAKLQKNYDKLVEEIK
jgi:hypothetical protein